MVSSLDRFFCRMFFSVKTLVKEICPFSLKIFSMSLTVESCKIEKIHVPNASGVITWKPPETVLLLPHPRWWGSQCKWRTPSSRSSMATKYFLKIRDMNLAMMTPKNLQTAHILHTHPACEFGSSLHHPQILSQILSWKKHKPALHGNQVAKLVEILSWMAARIQV